MEQRDYILREIEKIGMLIQAMLGKLGSIDDIEKADQNNTVLSEELFKELGFSLDELLKLDSSDFSAILLNNKGLNGKNIELLADLLVQLSEKEDNKTSYLQKAFELYSFVNIQERTFCLNRDRKIQELKLEMGL